MSDDPTAEMEHKVRRYWTHQQLVAARTEIADDLAAARAREAELRKALEPFAKARLLPGAPDGGYLTGWLDEHDGMLTIDDVRRAATLLAASAPGGAAQAEWRRLNTREAELLAALGPFAERAKSIPPEADDDTYWGDDVIKVGAYRHAAKLLAASAPSGEKERDESIAPMTVRCSSCGQRFGIFNTAFIKARCGYCGAGKLEPVPAPRGEHWTCECNYMNSDGICTHCGKLRPAPGGEGK